MNEYSTRYSPAIDSMAKTAPDRWRLQGATNRQGSGAYLGIKDGVDAGAYLTTREAELHAFARQVYEERLAFGVAKEQARKDLPLSNYTEAYWKIDLRNLLHFLGLRLHPHAQEEIRAYAEAIATFVRALWPRTYVIFEERVLGGARLSRTEAQYVRELLANVEGRSGARPEYETLRKKLGVGSEVK